MGIDLYVGTLTRYWCHDWETSQQRFMKQLAPGDPARTRVIQLRPDGTYAAREPIVGAKAQAIRGVVVRWRAIAVSEIRKFSPPAQVWSEEATTAHFVESPSAGGWAGLLLWAAYDTRPDLLTGTIDLDDWASAPALRAVADDLDGPYAHLVTGCTIWLPYEFPKPLMAPNPASNEKWRVGSTPALLGALRRLNERTWRVEENRLAAIGLSDDDASTDFERCAQMGFRILWTQAQRAMEHALPMVMDF